MGKFFKLNYLIYTKLKWLNKYLQKVKQILFEF